jgi:hypothetical protein
MWPVLTDLYFEKVFYEHHVSLLHIFALNITAFSNLWSTLTFYIYHCGYEVGRTIVRERLHVVTVILDLAQNFKQIRYRHLLTSLTEPALHRLKGDSSLS